VLTTTLARSILEDSGHFEASMYATQLGIRAEILKVKFQVLGLFSDGVFQYKVAPTVEFPGTANTNHPQYVWGRPIKALPYHWRLEITSSALGRGHLERICEE
jgi:hypothetical protein